MATIRLKLLVDREKNRVVFAESDKEFVDVLFSFLTLPMGTIIRLLNKQSSVGWMDKLYESVENLDAKYLETEACKMMLLQPRSEAEILCEDLRVNADDLEPRRLYRCPAFGCFIGDSRAFSSISGARCRCGRAMDKFLCWDKQKKDAKDYGFLKGAATFVISDDLHVSPAAVTNPISLLEKFGVKDVDTLEERVVQVGRKEVLCLLNSLLLSKTPFTDVFLRKRTPVQDVLSSIGNFLHVKHVSCLLAAGQALSSLKSLLVLKTPFRDIFSQKKRSVQIYKEENEILATEVWNNAFQFKPISVKILENMVTNKVVYAEAGSDFVDVLLSFLTFPLGSIVKLMNCQSSLGCVDNLYGSVELLATTGDFIKSDECKNMLLSPKLYPHFNCDDQILRIGTKLSTDCTVLGCETCYNAGSNECKHNIGRVILNEINPKMPNAVTRSGGGYAERALRFMVTDEMAVAPVSHISVIGAIKELRVPVSILFENEVKLGEREVLNLLKACLISSNPLSQIFSHKSFSHKKLRRIA